MPAVRITFYKPAEPLQPYLSAYYFADLAAGDPVEDRLHPEWGNVRFALSGFWTFRTARSSGDSSEGLPARLYGPTSHATDVVGYPPTRTANAGILPLGWARLIGMPAHRYADRIVPLAEAFGTEESNGLFAALQAAPDDTVSCAVLNDFFLRRLENSPQPAPLLAQAHALLVDPGITTAQAFAERLGVSSRQMARLSLDMFGFAPKLLLRRQRFLRTLQRLRSNPDDSWSRQLDDAYYDQSHFVRDFHDFMGRSPTEYFADKRVLLDPAASLRREAIGETLQGLHPASRKPG
jgi:AraC-like DNA-binding protein